MKRLLTALVTAACWCMIAAAGVPRPPVSPGYKPPLQTFTVRVLWPWAMMSHQEVEQYLYRLVTPWPELLLTPTDDHEDVFWLEPENPQSMNLNTRFTDLAHPPFRNYYLAPPLDYELTLGFSLGCPPPRGETISGAFFISDPPPPIPIDFPWCRGITAPKKLSWLPTSDVIAP